MVRQSLRALPIGAVALLSALTLAPAPAAAVTPLTDCADLTKAGETYVLTADITTTDLSCFLVLADRITIDLAGHTVTGPTGAGSVAIWDNDGARILTVVKNGNIRNFGFGIFLSASTRNTVRSVDTSDNGLGMVIGSSSLVKDCTVQRNTNGGIQTGNGTQVEGCVIGGPAGDGNGNGPGLAAGGRTLATRNTVIGNAQGILVGANSTVTHNTVGNNLFDGIQVDSGSLVTRNTSNDNGGDGIQAICPATITHNTALGNGGLPINTSGGCVILHNTTTLPPPPAP
jgi:hypothetical protein